MLFLLIVSVLAPTAIGSNDLMWSIIPAAHSKSSHEEVEVPNATKEDEVRIVGVHLPEELPEKSLCRVLSIELPSNHNESSKAPIELDANEASIPTDAQWPDEHDQIALDRVVHTDTNKDSFVRNPWEVRIIPKNARSNDVFFFGSIIEGGEAGPIAILNGQIVKRGDTVGEYSVSSILVNALMLDRNGSHIVIPLGKRITVAIAGL